MLLRGQMLVVEEHDTVFAPKARRISANRVSPGGTARSVLVVPSTPQLTARQGRPLRQRFELGPSDLRMHSAAETAIGGGDDPLPADEVGEANNPLGDEFGVLDDVGGVADDPWQDQLVVGQFDILPDFPLVLVAHIAGLERIGTGVDGQHDIDDVAHRDVGGMRPCQLPQHR
jgi:hypothetical protein